VDTPDPNNLTELRVFLGMVNYYSMFLENISTVLHPLHELLKKNTIFIWNKECMEAFKKIKEIIISDQVLVYYNPLYPLILNCDASEYGLGAVLSHKFNNNIIKPICFASHTLSVAEKNYAVTHKEALAIFWGVQKFYQYLKGRSFVINWAAENSVKTFKQGFIKMLSENTTLPTKKAIKKYVFAPHCTTKETPKMVFNKKIRTRFDCLRDNSNMNANLTQCINYKGNVTNKVFKIGDNIYARDYSKPNKKGWISCVIDDVIGKTIYLCKNVNIGEIYKRHTDQIIKEGQFYKEIIKKINHNNEQPNNEQNNKINLKISNEGRKGSDNPEIIKIQKGW